MIEKETAPFLFKILMFPPEGTQITREFETELHKELKDYLDNHFGASQIQTDLLLAKKNQDAKIKCTF